MKEFLGFWSFSFDVKGIQGCFIHYTPTMLFQKVQDPNLIAKTVLNEPIDKDSFKDIFNDFN